jgi:hypothetical protein
MANPDFSDLDSALDGLWAQLAERQAAYRRGRGRYWQGLDTPATLPEEGADAAPDPARAPDDQAEDWAAAGIVLPARLAGALAVHVYDGPDGQGYVLMARARRGGGVWAAARQAGPEGWRSHPWREEGEG